MADFVAVLRKTIGALGENTPEMREKVYDKARSTIDAKLAAINPPPPAGVAERQRKALEDAIAVVRAEYAGDTEAEQDQDLEDVFASLRTMGNVTGPAKTAGAPSASAAPAQRPKEGGSTPLVAPAATTPAPSSAAIDPAAEDSATLLNDGPEVERDPSSRARASLQTKQRGTSSMPRLVAALVLLLVLAGGSYAVWVNRDDFAAMAGLGSAPATTPEPVVTTAEELVEEEPAPESAALPAEEPAEEPAPEVETGNEPEVAAAPVEDEADPDDVDKFTQRLLPDGSEVDAGRAGGDRTIGEGTSVAAVAPPDGTSDAGDATETETAQAAEDGEAAAESDAAEEPAASEQSVAIAQRAIFYEERTTSAQGSAEAGTIVWSLVQESPGGDLPPEPAIRAEANIPGKDVQLRMTIRRNGDQSLPASHIVEMIFLTPEDFEGGGISSVSRISFKETEQAAGNPLIGIPAKIADGFFLIALGNAPAEIEANTTLLRRQSWVDIPIVYQSGRRALLSLEKGIPGDRVFEQALQAWSEASSG